MFYLVVATVAILITVILIGPIKMSMMRLHRGHFSPISASDIPEECVEALIEGEKFLIQNGFKLQQHASRGAVIVGQPWGAYAALYYCELDNCWAVCYVEPTTNKFFDFRFIFLSEISKEKYLATISGGEFDGIAPLGGRVYIQDALTQSPTKQLVNHRRRSRELQQDITLRKLDLPNILALTEYVFFDSLVEDGVLTQSGDTCRLPFFKAIKVMRRVQFIARALAHEKVDKNALVAKPASEKREWNAYETFQSIRSKNTLGWLPKIALLLLSVVIFGVAFGVDIGFHSVLILVAVLLFHELGHMLGMWLFSYKDLNMLFIPFVGALVTGRKKEVNNWQEAVILLLGPVPGYAIGVYLMLGVDSTYAAWVYELALIAIIVNLFNLLPFMPLDGGRLVELALFGRYPRAQLVFSCLSILGLLIVAYVLETYALLIIPVLLIIGLPFAYKKSQITLQLFQEASLPTTEREIFNKVRVSPIWGKLNQQEQWNLIENLHNDLRYAKASLISGIAIIFTWLACSILPPIIMMDDEQRQNARFVWSLLFDAEPYQESIQDLEERFVQSDSLRDKSHVAMQLISRSHYSTGFESKADKEAMGDIDEEYYIDFIKSAIDSETLEPLDRGRYATFMAGICDDTDSNCRISWSEKAVTVYQTSENTIPQAISLLYSLSYETEQSIDSRYGYLSRAEQLVAKADDPATWQVIINNGKAMLAHLEGNPRAALQWLRESLDITRGQSTEALSQQWKLLVAFQYGIGELDEAKSSAEAWAREMQSINHKDRSSKIDQMTVGSVEGYDLLDLDVNYVLFRLWLEAPEKAENYLERVSASTLTGKIEIQLARIMLAGDEKDSVSNIKALSDQVEEWEWYALAYRLGAVGDKYEGPIDDWDALITKIDTDYYKRLGDIAKRDDLMFLNTKMGYNTDEYY